MDYMGNFNQKENDTNKTNEEYEKVITLRTVIGIIVCLLISFTLLYFGISSKLEELKTGHIHNYDVCEYSIDDWNSNVMSQVLNV